MLEKLHSAIQYRLPASLCAHWQPRGVLTGSLVVCSQPALWCVCRLLYVRGYKLAIIFVLVVHACSCVWYAAACPLNVCRDHSWAEDDGNALD